MMKKIFKILLKSVFTLVSILLLIFIILYFIHSGTYSVAETVAQDESIPSLEVNGTKLHVETYGNKNSEPLLVIHGGPGNDFLYLLDLSALADEYYVIFYDQRGSGLSERVPVDELTYDNMILDLEALADHFRNDRKINMIGHSWGAMLASAYLGRNPDKVDRIVLAEPGFLNPAMYDRFKERTNNFSVPFTWSVIRHLIRSFFESLHVTGPDDQARSDYFFYRFIVGADAKDHPMAGYYCDLSDWKKTYRHWRLGSLAMRAVPASGEDEEGNFRIDFAEGVRAYSDTVLFLTGECNSLIGYDFQVDHMALFNNNTIREVPGAGHNMVSEKPGLVIPLIRQYLSNSKTDDE